ncbi:MAG TPA: hypothetical protein PLH92_17650 [Mycobacterium sp.]|uniref:hypothetical protein n=1 Tax=Mycolicibacterium sp. TaxID=2320850 RepID=UPI0025ED9A2D|nr:hypothetical protein [Mycolicibacterium sp.]HQC78534.1 hypothetical protein [Mycobacterium sp.]
MSDRRGRLVRMRSVLASRNQELYTFTARTVSDIADRLGSHHVEALSSSDGTYQFWFTPTMSGRRLNGPATKLLFAFTGFAAAQTPLLRGDVVITSRTAAGEPDGLSDDHIGLLIESLRAIDQPREARLSESLSSLARTLR